MSEKQRKHLGQRIRAARHKAGLAVRDVARRLDVAENTIYRWELGVKTPSVETLRALGKVLKTTFTI